MREFEIIKLEIITNIDVEIEFLDDRSRQRFIYPVGQGWENEIDGEQKFIINIRQRVEDGEFNKIVAENIDVAALQKKFVGKKFLNKAVKK